MSSFSTLYLVHFLLFTALAGITFTMDVLTPAVACGDNVDTLEMMRMVGSYCYLGCMGLALVIFALSKYFSGNFLPGDFGGLTKWRKCLGFFLRVSVYLLTLAHWVLIAPMAFFILTYLTGSECYMLAMGTS